MLQNTPHFVLALLGAWKAGATVVPVNPMYKSAEVAPRPDDAEVTALICSDRAWEAYLRETRRRARPCGSRSPPANWTSRPATTRACSRFERLPAAARTPTTC